ncbi:MAG: hypothetical protein LBJ41_05690 [Treponema sp.]|jgi:hypothetical protein|nr:hypothetical protein [Treponema sp.]
MAHKGCTDTDMGLDNIFKELDQFRNRCIKVGVTEDAGSKEGKGEATVAQYAAWNELGVRNKKGGWFIPPRSFVRGWADAKRENIAKTMEKLVSRVSSGELKAETAIRYLGGYGRDGIKSYINNGDFAPNSDVTIHGSKPDKNGKKFIKGKGSSKPLIDTRTMLISIRYQIIEKPVDMVNES